MMITGAGLPGQAGDKGREQMPTAIQVCAAMLYAMLFLLPLFCFSKTERTPDAVIVFITYSERE